MLTLFVQVSLKPHLLFLHGRHRSAYLEHWELLGVRFPCFLDKLQY